MRPMQMQMQASCHSLRVGEVFLKAGCRFVICVDRHQRVLDSASRTFASAFYHALVMDTPVPQAFAIAELQVRVTAESESTADGGDAAKQFVLLSRETDDTSVPPRPLFAGVASCTSKLTAMAPAPQASGTL